MIGHLFSDPINIIDGGVRMRSRGWSGCVLVRRQTLLGRHLPFQHVLALHGAGGGEAGGLAGLVLSLLLKSGQILALSLSPFMVSLNELFFFKKYDKNL